MRVLVVHNYYRSAAPSGENRSVRQEVAALRDAGVDVAVYERHSDDIAAMGVGGRLRLAARPVWSLVDARALAERCDALRPDVVHVHNVTPLISAAAVRVPAARGIPVVQAVRNYRFECAAGTFFRDGDVCTDCVGRRVPWPAVAHGCYRGSAVQSVPVAAGIAAHPVRRLPVARFLPVSGFVGQALRRAGVPTARITVKPNFVPDPGAPVAPASRGGHLLVLGRLEPSKGDELLAEAWGRLTAGDATVGGRRPRLVVVGDGPGRQALADRRLPGLEVRGHVAPHEVDRLLAAARAVVVPSLWHEPFGRTAIEAFAHARPVVATDRGGLAEVVDDTVGWSTAPAGPALAAAMAAALTDDGAVDERGARARDRYLARYTPQASLGVLQRVYDEVRAVG